MRKSVISTTPPTAERDNDQGWLDLDQLASVQVTSESPDFPIEAALSLEGTAAGWRAQSEGEQVIRILFDTPTRIRRIQLKFSEPEVERTQEFVLRWAPANEAMREIVRQQWNFSPTGSTAETESYTVDLENLVTLELVIQPGIGQKKPVASLQSLRVA